MANVFATWICIDNEDNASYFPSSKGSSNDVEVQNIYWRCLATCFYTARKFNPDLKLIAFSNQDKLPVIDGVNFELLFKYLNIEFHTTPFEYQTPIGYYNNWRNQFYEFSILKFILDKHIFKEDDVFILLDSDCIITGDLTNLYKNVLDFGCITYKIDYKPDFIINGLTRTEMKSIFEKLDEKIIDHIPIYHAGEFFAATVKTIQKIMDLFYPTWVSLLKLHQENKPHLHEEAHVLSYLFYKIGCEGGKANEYIKRIWTDPTTYRNVIPGDENYKIWHLPAEKRYGFKKLFKLLKKNRFDLNAFPTEELVKKLKIIFQVPSIPYNNKIYYFIKGLAKVLLKK
jgi:hypothetical protein